MFKNKSQFFLSITVVLLLLIGCKSNDVFLNDIQIIGSHNSYKLPIEKPLFDYLQKIDSNRMITLEYGHIALTKQLDLGLRNLELDVFYDPKGGHYSQPKGLDIVALTGKKALPFDTQEKLKVPGLKMFHIQDIDFRSHHLLFTDGLEEIKEWSIKNPHHYPIIILVNTKDQQVSQTKKPLPFDTNALNRLDQEISSVFSNDKLITPDLVRGDYKTLEEAILEKGWPKLNTLKGKFLFVLDEKEERVNNYLVGHPILKNRVLFTNSKEGTPEAAFRIINNPISDFNYIQELVSKGYMVRTRADAGTKEARIDDYNRFKKAKTSGAQVISTDYYLPSSLFKSDFKVIFDDFTYTRIKKK